MFGFMKSPLNKITKTNSVDPPGSSTSNPFDSDSESDNTKQRMTPARRTTSEPVLSDLNSNPFDDDDDDAYGRKPSSSSHTANRGGRNSYQNDFRDSGGFENQSVEELENYAVYKAEETTKSVNSCLKIAEDIREDASKTLVTLHQQGEQITRTHAMCQDIDQDLSRGEKLLGSLGGMFSKTWKPKKTRAINGPIVTADNSSKAKASKEQREKLGVAPIPKGPKNSQGSAAESSSAMQKVEEQKDKQDDALNDLSNILCDLKSMAVDMGSELERQNKALDGMDADVEELNSRVKQANTRGRRLLGK
ncbi:hypothetical protein MKW94_007955 [Papaver nudicaule]|uniref:t-SNARE coiled-coil homology domain-containing protein n=1 Tax=Papaver nudicaule TaxID=74823 RepID=A0AA41V140_PAPNU|nr:hypothetical protein [Papaver nudicaule]